VKTPFFSIFIPVYNSSSTIADTLKSVFNQSFTDFEVIVGDNDSKDNTLDIVKQFNDPRLIIKKNATNLGYSGNLNQGLLYCHSNNIFILAGDDLIDINALKWYWQALKKYPQAGAITRPYYWFDQDYRLPVRLKQTTKTKDNILINITDSFDKIFLVFSTLDQCSGLCFKRNLTTQAFGSELWIAHAYPWLDIFKKHPVIFLKNYPLAVRIGQSSTRTNIYQNSPMIFWKNMINSVFKEDKFKTLRNKILTDFVAANFIGLIQIRNYGSFYFYIREVKQLIIFNKKNLINYKFWLIFMLTLLTPPVVLRTITDLFKNIVYRKTINQNIVINQKNI